MNLSRRFLSEVQEELVDNVQGIQVLQAKLVHEVRNVVLHQSSCSGLEVRLEVQKRTSCR